MTNARGLRVETPSDCEIVLTRAFDAPRQMVFDALTKPDLLKRWFAPHGWSLAVCEVDLKVGGRFHFVMERPGGGRTGMRGVWREIAPPERLVHTESFPANRKSPRSSSNRTAGLRSRLRRYLPQRRFVTRSSKPARTAWRSATTNWPRS